MFDALLLDFYGTLVDETDVIERRIALEIARAAEVRCTASEVSAFWSSRFLGECGLASGDLFRTQQGIDHSALQATLDRFSANIDCAELVAPIFAYARAPILRPDARRFVAALGCPLAIVSNIDRDDLEAALGHVGISVEVVVTSEDVRAYKPRAEPFETALRTLGASASRTLHVGDSWRSDVVGAGLCGISVAWVNPSRRAPGDDAQCWADVPDLAALAERLDLDGVPSPDGAS